MTINRALSVSSVIIVLVCVSMTLYGAVEGPVVSDARVLIGVGLIAALQAWNVTQILALSMRVSKLEVPIIETNHLVKDVVCPGMCSRGKDSSQSKS